VEPSAITANDVCSTNLSLSTEFIGEEVVLTVFGEISKAPVVAL
jgi:hypothetical protein